MNEKRVLQYILASLFLLFLAPLSEAQDGESLLVISKTERRYIQRLAWAGDEYTLRYQIVVEKEEEGSYRRIRQVFTRDSFIELTLQPGNYRCRVIPYDFFDRPGEGSEWMAFEIPDIGEDEAPEPDPEPEEEILIAEPEPEEFEPEKPEPVKKEKILDFYLNVAWMPVLPVYGRINQFSEWNNTLYNGGIRLGVVSSTRNSLDFGLEFVISRNYFTSNSYEYEYGVQYVKAIEVILLAQKWFPKRVTALNLRAGGGYTSFPAGLNVNDFNFTLDSYHIDLGFSFLWRPYKHFYLETGIDYIYLFEWESIGLLRPWFGMGLRF
jgi:hypothetical protein